MLFFNPFHPPPAPPGFGIGKTVPTAQASYLSQLVVQWLNPFLEVGFSRPLEKEDLWELPEARLTGATTDALEASFYPRCPPEKRPNTFRVKSTGLVVETVSEKPDDSSKKKSADKPKRFWQRKQQEFDSSLFLAIHHTFFWRIWTGGILKLFADTLKTTSPLVTKALLTWLTESYVVYHVTDAEKTSGLLSKPRGVGFGIGLGFVLFAMQEISSLMTNHSTQAMMTVGLSVRTGIIGSVIRKSMRLSGRARLERNVGQTTTIISTDAARLDQFSQFGHKCVGISFSILANLPLSLGYSALVGLAVLLLGFPLQGVLLKIMFSQRKKGVKITDTRVRLSSEVLQGIRLIKYYAWEDFYTHQIGDLREREIVTVRKTAVARASLIALNTLVPVLASILSFIIRAPLIFIPFVLASLTDALVALGRIGKFLTAEELPEPYPIDYKLQNAVQVDASFAWETARKIEEPKLGPGAAGGKAAKGKKGAVLPTAADSSVQSGTATPAEEKPFELQNLKFSVPKGAFVAIVGRVGSGKSSILQALIGEMRRTSGTVEFGGSIAYVPQSAWIRNATLRQNITFGQEEDEDKFRQIIRACSLVHDLEVLPHGEKTEIGERGINLSGGQKARVSLARAAYSMSDVILLDDPLSAVDSFVGKAILENCILHGPLADRTRILVTHALHVLDKADYIYVMDNGTIKEEGTYDTLMKDGVVFCRLMQEYGNLDHEDRVAVKSERGAIAAGDKDVLDAKKDQAALMQTEERQTGAVSWQTYGKYLKFAGGVIWAPVILGLLTFTQAAQVSNNLVLGFWTANSLKGFRQGDYMAVYAALGVAQAFFSFLTIIAFCFASLIASLNLFKAALAHVLHSPSSFFDTTPAGRIPSRLVKDQDTLDNELALTLWQLLSTFSSVVGTVVLVFYTFPLLGIIFAPMSVLYYIVSIYYRRSSVETKRLDSLMRSALYASYSENLTGLATIRAYREQDDAVKHANHGLDLENRAYLMTITLQCWLSLRLDVFGNILILGIALFAVGFRHTINPSQIGVVLSYTLTNSIIAQMISMFAQNEQNMNSVERVLTYAELPAEGAATTPNDPPSSWPDRGEISFKNVEMAYREGLSLVLKDVSFDTRPGEKVGIVGRTGAAAAGKSSLLQALFRIVELQSGKIEIDGQNIRNVGLDVLRGRLALVPQDSVLFLGTLRENLDPQNLKTDAELISVLQRAWLLPRAGEPADRIADSKFSLDSTIGDEGSNYSAGEKQLLALCRALVKNSCIIVLDEATSSVDVETDAKLQRTIRTEFAAATLLCIAHRLNTIAYYDRILVMDQGQVAEYDTVLNLFDKDDSIFRSLCNEANLTRADILRIRAENLVEAGPSS
ncbi:multidrug resistance-associated ABC transporter [Mycena epipterygia]|nr:multidrug resistance-associated ABC transporter [Mycena epipterygia]